MPSLHLLYHELRPAGSDYSYVIPCEEFEEHCALYAHLRSGAPESASSLRPEITFDDGHSSGFRYALPILARHGLTATFFITAGWTGVRAGYMSWPELRALLEGGHRLGAHGFHHKLLTGCSDQERVKELQGSRNLLEDNLGVEIRAMSLPGGRSDARVLRACEEAGYQQIYTSAPSAVDLSAGSAKLIGRLNLVSGTTTAWLNDVLHPATGALKRLERLDRAKGFAKKALGDGLYARLWALVNRQEADHQEAEAPGT